MKAFVFSSLLLASVLFPAGCKFEDIAPEIPPVTYETIINPGYGCFNNHMCLQNDGDIRIVTNQSNGPNLLLVGGQLVSAIILVDSKGKTIWKRSFGPAEAQMGGISTKEVTGYYLAYSTASTFGLLDVGEDAAVEAELAGQSFYFNFTIGRTYPVQLLRDGPVNIVLCGNTEANDSLHIVTLDRDFIGPLKVNLYRSLDIPDTYGSCITQTTNGALLVCGKTSNGNLRLVRVDTNDPDFDGEFVDWNKSDYNLEIDNYSTPWVVPTGDEGCLVASSNSSGIFLLKTDAAGNKKWVTSPISGQGQHCNFILATRDGNYLLCGTKDSQAYAAKFGINDNGPTLIWEKTYSKGTLLEQAIETDDNGFLMLGTNEGADKGILLVKTDLNGDVY